MDQKSFTLLFIALLFIVAGGMLIARYQSADQASLNPSPSPTIDTALFGNQSAKNNQMANLTPDQIQQLQQQQKLQQQQNQQSSVQGTQRKNCGPNFCYDNFPGILSDSEIKDQKAVIETSKGTIEFEIYPDSPLAASNFIFLSKETFYDGLAFQRVAPGFVIQGGDPLMNNTGGPGYTFKNDPVTRKYVRGTVAMANAGIDTNGSQFFIVLSDNNGLNADHSWPIFGKVIKGMDIVDQIAQDSNYSFGHPETYTVINHVFIRPIK